MQPNGMIFWDWNGTLMDDVDFTHSCLNWMLETHGYPQRYDLAAYRELFGFPIEDYYRCAGFDFARHPYPELAARFMEHYNAGVPGCAVTAHAVDTLQTLARMGWQQDGSTSLEFDPQQYPTVTRKCALVQMRYAGPVQE